MDAVAAWKGHEDEVPSVRVEADQDGPDDDAERSQTPAHGCGQGIGVEETPRTGARRLAAGIIRSLWPRWAAHGVAQPLVVYVEA